MNTFCLLFRASLVSMWAQARISSAYAEARGFPATAGVTGAEAAAMVMRAGGVTGVAIEPVAGELSDHYDPRHKVFVCPRVSTPAARSRRSGWRPTRQATPFRMPRIILGWSSAT